MLYRVFPPSERVRAASILTVPTTMAPALGPVLGGFLVTNLSWRWVFFVNLPIGIAAVIFGVLCLERTGTIDAGRFDVPGFLLGGAGLGLVMYGVSEGPLKSWSSTDVIGSCVSGRRAARRLRRGGAADRPADGGPAPAVGTACSARPTASCSWPRRRSSECSISSRCTSRTRAASPPCSRVCRRSPKRSAS